eukprot:COSAG01_NODE_62845_length_282_cov_1.568306_1_plen_89_part_10
MGLSLHHDVLFQGPGGLSLQMRLLLARHSVAHVGAPLHRRRRCRCPARGPSSPAWPSLAGSMGLSLHHDVLFQGPGGLSLQMQLLLARH